VTFVKLPDKKSFKRPAGKLYRITATAYTTRGKYTSSFNETRRTNIGRSVRKKMTGMMDLQRILNFGKLIRISRRYSTS
jgi:3D (Asp-Asp-Asp) domain-containing protein